MTAENIYFIAGATAVGKSRVAIDLAKEIDGEIVSADSMQIYRYMDIGTAKVTLVERQEIPHHLVDVVFPDEEFSVVKFQKMAYKAMIEIKKRGKKVIVVGGSGFYINSLLYETNFTEMPSNEILRRKFYNIAQEKGNLFLHELLLKIDKKSAEAIHPNNVKRVIRALEYYKLNKKRISEHNEIEKRRSLRKDAKIIILDIERNNLYERINHRVEEMFKAGLIEEVENLFKLGYHENLVSMQGIGYKETVLYLHGVYSFEEAKEIIAKETRHYAKRQLTWLKHQCSSGIWINVDELKIHDIISNA